MHLQRDEDGRIVGASGESGGEDQEHDDGADAAAESALLHFSTPRDAATIAAFLRTRVYRPESLVWLEGYQALLRWRKQHKITGLHAVPYDTETELGATRSFPLGRWVHQQRKALRVGELDPHRKELLDAPEAGMVWEPGEEAWENKVGTLRSYGAPPVPGHWTGNATTASWPSSPPTNPTAGSPTSHPASSSTATTSDDGCSDRSSRAPGRSSPERLTRLGIQPLQAPSPAPAGQKGAKRPGKAQQAFQRGLTALAQWIEQEGAHRPVPRGAVVEIAVDGEAEPVPVRLGVWISNTRSRRDKLDAEQVQALRELGVEWA